MNPDKAAPLVVAVLGVAWSAATVIAKQDGAAPPVKIEPAPPPAAAAPPPAAARGELLYENHCTRCHASTVHVRANRRAKTLGALEGWVRRWAEAEKLGWGPEEIADVADYLDRRYYKLREQRRN